MTKKQLKESFKNLKTFSKIAAISIVIGGIIPIMGVREPNIIIPDDDEPSKQIALIEELPIGGELIEAEIENVKIKIPDWKALSPIVCQTFTQEYSLEHRGWDLVNIKCEGNQGIFAIADGMIISKTFDGIYGKRMEINHGNGFISSYSHLDGFINEVGNNVKKRQEIGIMGSTGRSTGRHLHFELIYNGQKVNPERHIPRN